MGIDGEKNEILKAIGFLENEYLIERDNSWYKINTLGIDKYEETLDASEISPRITERKMILQFLKETYDVDTTKLVTSEELMSKLGQQEKVELLSQMHYLVEKRFVYWELAMGGTFWARLTPEGSKEFDNYETHNYQIMTNAYRTLFLLENRLRLFIEQKLTEKYSSDWFKEGISDGQRNKIEQKKIDEAFLGWEISNTKSNMEYLSFPDLGKIIQTQWKQVFESIFKDQSKILLRLDELERIRNSIAHTRTLSNVAISRLEQYSNDIFNLTSR